MAEGGEARRRGEETAKEGGGELARAGKIHPSCPPRPCLPRAGIPEEQEEEEHPASWTRRGFLLQAVSPFMSSAFAFVNVWSKS